jgi:hypothetical protein
MVSRPEELLTQLIHTVGQFKLNSFPCASAAHYGPVLRAAMSRASSPTRIAPHVPGRPFDT